MKNESLGIALYQTNNIEDPSKVTQLGYHTHNTIEFSYIHSGTIDFWCQNKKEVTKITILKNQMIIIFPNVSHRFDINNWNYLSLTKKAISILSLIILLLFMNI